MRARWLIPGFGIQLRRQVVFAPEIAPGIGAARAAASTLVLALTNPALEALTQGLSLLLTAVGAHTGAIWRTEADTGCLSLACIYPSASPHDLSTYRPPTLSAEEWSTLAEQGMLEYDQADGWCWLSLGEDSSALTAQLLLLGLPASGNLTGVLALGFSADASDLERPV